MNTVSFVNTLGTCFKASICPSLKTKEDYVAWLKITKNNVYAYNLEENLVIWNKSKNSLSSSFFQKIKDF